MSTSGEEAKDTAENIPVTPFPPLWPKVGRQRMLLGEAEELSMSYQQSGASRGVRRAAGASSSMETHHKTPRNGPTGEER